MATIADPFILAAERQIVIQDDVLGKLDESFDDSRALIQAHIDGIDAIANFMPELEASGSAPSAPGLPGFSGNVTLPAAPGAPVFPDAPVKVAPPNAPQLEQVPAIVKPVIEDFNPNTGGISLPTPPSLGGLPPAPVKPTIAPIVIPAKPVLQKPLAPHLQTVNIPAFDFSQISYFDETAPDFTGNAGINAVLQWTEQPYQPEVMPEVLTHLRRLWDGGLGLAPGIEQAIMDRAAAREDMAVARDVDAAALDFSSRGFTMPPGAMVARIQALRADGQRNKLSASRELAIRAAEIQVENLKFACGQAIGAEQLLSTIWNNMVQRAFEAAKVELDAQLSVLNAHIALYNARQSAWASKAQAKKAELDTRLAAIRMELDAELAKGEVNKDNVALYEAQMRALQVDASLYETEMKGAQTRAEIDRLSIDGFKAETSAWADGIQVLKVQADIYDSQMKGEATKSSVLESQARAYSSYVGGQTARLDADVKLAESVHRGNEMRLRAWIAQLDADKAQGESWLRGVQALAAAYDSRVRGFTAEAGATTEVARLSANANEAAARVAIQLYETKVREYLADLEQLRAQAGMRLEAIKSGTQATSTLAAGLMAGRSISASISGNANLSASGSRTDQGITVIP